ALRSPDPGGPFIDNPDGSTSPNPKPDVRNAFGIEGGVDLVLPPTDPGGPIFFFKPVNAELRLEGCEFNDLPGQAGIFAPQVVGRDDPAWTFDPEAAAPGSISVQNCFFADVALPVLVPDISDVELDVRGSVFTGGIISVLTEANFQKVDLDSLKGKVDYHFDFPEAVASSVRVNDNVLDGASFAAVLAIEHPPFFVLDGRAQG